MTLAESIREHVIKTYLGPARASGRNTVIFDSGTIHSALNLDKRMPAVCSAIDAKLFETEAGIKLTSREGPKFGARARWTFEI